MGQIYKHTSPSGKSYIGQTTRTWQLRAGKDPIKGYHGSTKFKNAIRKYGWDNFTHEVLEDGITDPDELDMKEKFWIEKFDCVKNGYNSLGGATGISYPAAGEIPIKLRNLPKETLENLYSVEGYSTPEIGAMFDCSHNSVIAALQIHKIPRRPLGSPGKREREFNALKAPVEKPCSICGNPFISPKKTAETCSKPCSGKLAAQRMSAQRRSASRHRSEGYMYPDASREILSQSMKGNTNSVGNIGGKISMHNRWHVKRNIINPDCSLCITDESLLQVS